MKHFPLLNNIAAIATLALGHILVFLDFFLTENHVVHEPTLWYFGQCCVLFGTVIGVIQYVKTSVKDTLSQAHPKEA